MAQRLPAAAMDAEDPELPVELVEGEDADAAGALEEPVEGEASLLAAAATIGASDPELVEDAPAVAAAVSSVQVVDVELEAVGVSIHKEL